MEFEYWRVNGQSYAEGEASVERTRQHLIMTQEMAMVPVVPCRRWTTCLSAATGLDRRVAIWLIGRDACLSRTPRRITTLGLCDGTGEMVSDALSGCRPGAELFTLFFPPSRGRPGES